MAAPPGSFPWNAEHIATLTELWPAWSSSMIAHKLGCSRNAVIGKAHRLGLMGVKPRGFLPENSKPKNKRPSPPKSNGGPGEIKRTRKSRFSFGRAHELTRSTSEAPKVPPDDPILHCDEPVSLDILLAGLTDHTCKWPHGETTPYLFCGHVTFNSAYCPHHDRRSRGRSAPHYSDEQRALMRERYVRREHAGKGPSKRISHILEADAFCNEAGA